jgi:thioredoxin-like negative regulator of GroEL
MPPRPASSSDLNAVIARIARDLLALLGNGVPRAEAAIVAALADRHPKDDIKRAIARLAVLEQLVETGSKHTLAEPGQG